MEVAGAAQGDGLGGQKFRFLREAFQGFVRPDFGFVIFAKLDEHADLGGPGGCVLGIEFQDARVTAEGFFEVGVFERGLSLAQIKGLVLGHALLRGQGLVLGFSAEFKFDKPAH